MDDRLMNSTFLAEDSGVEQTLRPHTLRDYVGQKAVKDSLGIYIEAALSRHDSLDHMLLYGPPGLGKTTLACIVAAAMGHSQASTTLNIYAYEFAKAQAESSEAIADLLSNKRQTNAKTLTQDK